MLKPATFVLLALAAITQQDALAGEEKNTVPETWKQDQSSKLVLRTTASKLRLASKIGTATYCAPINSEFMFDRVETTYATVEFSSVSSEPTGKFCEENSEKVEVGGAYIIEGDAIDTVRYKVTGLTYGTLIVPFKFRMGSDRKIASSSTIAPYLGFRSRHFQMWGNEIVPVVSAGLALVPVHDPATNTTDTKAAFSTAFGLTLRIARSDKFTAGVLLGKDFLGNTDKKLDPSVNKMWFSIWIGVSG